MQLWAHPLLHLLGLGGSADFYAKVALDIGVNVILAVSLTLVNGIAGQFSIGHAAFMAVGAYACAAVVYYGSFLSFGNADVQPALFLGIGWGDLLFAGGLLAGGALAALCGYVVGLPSLRLRGDYLAIVTLGFGEILRVLLQQSADVLYDADEIRAAPLSGVAQLFSRPAGEWETPLWWRLGGALGFSGLPFYTNLFWVTLVAALTIIIALRLKRSAMGRSMLAVREDEIAARAFGVDTTRCKVRAFVIAAFLAGLAGGLYAHMVGVQLSAQELGFQRSFDIIIMVVLGGLGSISGAALAAVLVTILPELLRAPESLAFFWPWLLGAALVLAAGALAAKSRRLAGGAVLAGVLSALCLLAGVAARAGVDLGRHRLILFALCLILVMILRPRGLLGVREVWELWPFSKLRRSTP